MKNSVINRRRSNNFIFSSEDLNTQRNPKCRSNSLFHYKQTANTKYEQRISLSPEGELKFEPRGQIVPSHIPDLMIKTNYIDEFNEKKADNKAYILSDINSNVQKQKYQLLLSKDLHINKICQTKNNEIKAEFENKKKHLKEQLTTIIKDSLL